LKYLSLSQNQFAKVDDEDYETLNLYKWAAAWSSLTESYYAIRSLRENGSKYTIRLHREILGLKKGDGRIGDHINHDTLDNQRSNLRLVDVSQSCMNRRLRKNKPVRFKGISFRKSHRKWASRITVSGNTIFLGYFNNQEDAYKAYCDASVKYHGEYARLV
jgi:hypothetical protein